MLINEAGLVRRLKSAYKHGGYVVNIQGDSMMIYSEMWFVKCKRAMLPRKALAAIVEHMGMIPENAPYSIKKDLDPQPVMEDVAAGDMDRWRNGRRGEDVTMVPVIMQGCQIFQPPGGGECWSVPALNLSMMERDAVEHYEGTVVDENRIAWEGNGETVILSAVRKAVSGWAKAWEQAVWQALESVDLHKEERA